MSRNTITEDEAKDFKDFIKKWAFKKMRKQEKRLQYYARIFFGEPVTIVYAREVSVEVTNVIHEEDLEGEIQE